MWTFRSFEKFYNKFITSCMSMFNVVTFPEKLSNTYLWRDYLFPLLIHDVINLLYYEHQTDKRKYFYKIFCLVLKKVIQGIPATKNLTVYIHELSRTSMIAIFFFNWNSLSVKLNNHYEARSYKKKKHKKITAYRKSV